MLNKGGDKLKNEPIIRTVGNTIQLLRYKVTYKVQLLEENKEIDCCICTATLEEANMEKELHEGTITPIDTTGQEWLEGINVGETDMPYDRALEIVQMGEQGYKNYIENQKKSTPEYLLQENQALKQQVTDLQLALTEMYETVSANSNNTIKG